MGLYNSGVLVTCFSSFFGHFLAWNHWRETPNLHIFYQNGGQMHVFQKNWCNHDINFKIITRIFKKNTTFLVNQMTVLHGDFVFLHGFKKTVFFYNLQWKIPFLACKIDISKSLYYIVFLILTSFFETIETMWFFLLVSLKPLLVSTIFF